MGVVAAYFPIMECERPAIQIHAENLEEAFTTMTRAFYWLLDADEQHIALVSLPVHNAGPPRSMTCVRNCERRVLPM